MEKIWDLSKIHNHYANDIESFSYKEHKEDGVIVDQESSAQYTFTIKDTNDPILFSSGFICVDVKITKSNNVSIDLENVTLENTGNLFDRATLSIGSNIIEEIKKPCFIHHINGLVNFTKDYESSEATNMLFFKDTADSTDRHFLKFEGNHADAEKMDTLIQKIKLNENYNKGFNERWKLTKNSSTVKIWIPLNQMFGFFNDYRKLMSGMDVQFVFTRNDYTNDMLYTNEANVDYYVTITNVSVWLPHVKLNPNAQAKYLENARNPEKAQMIEWIAPRLKSSNPKSDINGTIHVRTTTDDIVSIFVIPQYVERENNAKKSIMVFDHLDLIECHMTINDDRYPRNDYRVSFKEGEFNYSRYYSDFLTAGLNTNNTESGCLVSYEEYRKLYPIIYFDVSNHPPYINCSNLNVQFSWTLRNTPTKPFKFHFIVYEKRRGKMNMYNNNFEFLSTLKE